MAATHPHITGGTPAEEAQDWLGHRLTVFVFPYAPQQRASEYLDVFAILIPDDIAPSPPR